jgi:hypothetical protein
MIDPDGLYSNVRDFQVEDIVFGDMDYYIPKQSNSDKTLNDV